MKRTGRKDYCSLGAAADVQSTGSIVKNKSVEPGGNREESSTEEVQPELVLVVESTGAVTPSTLLSTECWAEVQPEPVCVVESTGAVTPSTLLGTECWATRTGLSQDDRSTSQELQSLRAPDLSVTSIQASADGRVVSEGIVENKEACKNDPQSSHDASSFMEEDKNDLMKAPQSVAVTEDNCVGGVQSSPLQANPVDCNVSDRTCLQTDEAQTVTLSSADFQGQSQLEVWSPECREEDIRSQEESRSAAAADKHAGHEDQCADHEDGRCGSRYDYSFFHQPLLIASAWMDFRAASESCFTKGCKWAPDGTCVLTNSDDNTLRLFNLPQEMYEPEAWNSEVLREMMSVVSISEGELIYDYCWYTLMSSDDPQSCFFLSTSRHSPVHMWDAFTGELRATYRSYDNADEIISAHSLAVDPFGCKLYCGFNKAVRIFDISVPGRTCSTRSTRPSKNDPGQCGIISCITINPAFPSVYAAGSYLRTIGLYSEPEGKLLCLLNGQLGGVTHMRFSPDGTRLYSGGRKDPEIICWDIRNLGNVLYVLQRSAATNQRIYFDMDSGGRFLVSGNSKGYVTVWDLAVPVVPMGDSDPVLLPVRLSTAHEDCVNGVSLHPHIPVLATSSGQRHFAEPTKDGSESDSDVEAAILKKKYIKQENSLKLWWAGKRVSDRDRERLQSYSPNS